METANRVFNGFSRVQWGKAPASDGDSRKWCIWLFAAGVWQSIMDDPGEGIGREELVAAYGGYSEAPMLFRTIKDAGTDIDIVVYSLDRRYFSEEQMAEVQAFEKVLDGMNDADWDAWLRLSDQWAEDHPDLAWFREWEGIYPVAYLVYVDHQLGDHILETHQIYCRAYPDLLALLKFYS